jgi:hypothetical protein
MKEPQTRYGQLSDSELGLICYATGFAFFHDRGLAEHKRKELIRFIAVLGIEVKRRGHPPLPKPFNDIELN